MSHSFVFKKGKTNRLTRVVVIHSLDRSTCHVCALGFQGHKAVVSVFSNNVTQCVKEDERCSWGNKCGFVVRRWSAR